MDLRKKLKGVNCIYKPYMAIKRETVLKFRHKNKIKVFHENGYRVLNEVEEALNASNLTTFISFGTLLGFIRDGGFIKHDDDIDICILNNSDKKWEEL